MEFLTSRSIGGKFGVSYLEINRGEVWGFLPRDQSGRSLELALVGQGREREGMTEAEGGQFWFQTPVVDEGFMVYDSSAPTDNLLLRL